MSAADYDPFFADSADRVSRDLFIPRPLDSDLRFTLHAILSNAILSNAFISHALVAKTCSSPESSQVSMPEIELPASAAPSVYRLEDVCFAYSGGMKALGSVSLDIARGENVVLLGANGCGKSTLIKMLDGLLFPQSGRLEAFGEPLTEKSLRDSAANARFRRRVGFIFQDSDAQVFSSTAREDIAFGPLHLGLSPEAVEQRVTDVAALLGITRLLDRAPYQLSGGEKKKVAIAGTLAVNPDVLLLDEPTAGLDPRSQQAIVALLQQLRGAGKTLVIATHDLRIVPEIASRAFVFSEQHTLAAEGATPSILADTELLRRVNLIAP